MYIYYDTSVMIPQVPSTFVCIIYYLIARGFHYFLSMQKGGKYSNIVKRFNVLLILTIASCCTLKLLTNGDK